MSKETIIKTKPERAGLKKQSRKNNALKASFTIEAAFIVPLSIFIVSAFLYMTFYLHDTAIAGSVCTGYILENAAQYQSSTAQIEADTADMLESRLIIAKDVSVNVSEDNGVNLEGSASFDMPFGFAESFLDIPDEITVSVNISMLNGRKKLLEYKAVSEGLDFLTGD